MPRIAGAWLTGIKAWQRNITEGAMSEQLRLASSFEAAPMRPVAPCPVLIVAFPVQG